jgi:hypothetical protein
MRLPNPFAPVIMNGPLLPTYVQPVSKSFLRLPEYTQLSELAKSRLDLEFSDGAPVLSLIKRKASSDRVAGSAYGEDSDILEGMGRGEITTWLQDVEKSGLQRH